MAQQTAVEWLESTFYTYAESFGINNDKWGINELKLEDILAIAKQMEKEHIVKAYVEGINLVPCDVNSTDELDAEKYYHKTFGNK